jgi:hypothetical protein
MTIFAHGGGLDVGYALASGTDAIVTCGTVGGGAVVIEAGGCPAAVAVAVITTVATGHMGGWFTHSGTTIVAGRAVAQYRGMVHTGDRGPGSGAMAILAHGGGLDVGYALASGSNSVMTATTASADRRVVKPGR